MKANDIMWLLKEKEPFIHELEKIRSSLIDFKICNDGDILFDDGIAILTSRIEQLKKIKLF